MPSLVKTTCFIATLALLGAATAAGTAPSTQPANITYTFTAEVQRVQFKDDFAGRYIPTGISLETRFMITLKVGTPPSDFPSIKKDDVITYGIHSPVLLFRGSNNPVGHKFTFIYTRRNGFADLVVDFPKE